VLIPSAKPSLMIGVNQVIMLALNMVIISSMIGAGGLGYDVLLALRRLAVGQAMEAGPPLRVVGDLVGPVRPAAARPSPGGGGAAWSRRLILALAVVVATTMLSLAWPVLAKVPSAITFSTAPWWKAVIDWITVNYFDALEIFRTGFLLHVLNPLRALFEGLP